MTTMRLSILLAICAVALLAGSASAQRYGYYQYSSYQNAYYPQSSATVVDVGGGYRLVPYAPYYRPASASAVYYRVGYSPAYQRYLTYPNFGPMAPAPYIPQSNPQIYYIPGSSGVLQPLR